MKSNKKARTHGRKRERERDIMSRFIVEEFPIHVSILARESARAAIMDIEGFVSLITTELDEQEAGEDCDFSSDFGELKGFVADLENDIGKLKR